MEAVQYAFRVRAVLGDARVDPTRPVAGDDPDGLLLLVSQLPEEQVEHVFAVSVVRPDHAVALMVDDDGQIRVALPVAGLVWFATVISHAHSDSKSLVARLPSSAHGTRATTTPHFGQSTRGIAATSSTRQQPKS